VSKKEGAEAITKFSNQAISSSMETMIADEQVSRSSDLRKDNFDATSTPAYFSSCILIGLFGGVGLDPFHISSTRFGLYR